VQNVELVQWGVAIGASLAAAITDVRFGKIPNWLTLPLWLTGLGVAWLYGGPTGLFEAFKASLLVAGPYIVLFVIGHGGAGDAKLMGGLGAWLGLRQGLIVFVSVAITGMVLAVLRVLAHGQRRVAGVGSLTALYVQVVEFCLRLKGLRRPEQEKDAPASHKTGSLTLPYGIAIFIGVCVGGLGNLIWNG